MYYLDVKDNKNGELIAHNKKDTIYLIEEEDKGGYIYPNENEDIITKLIKNKIDNRRKELISLEEKFIPLTPKWFSMFIGGPSGSGKSTIASIVAKNHKKIYKSKIYVISPIGHDEVLEKIGIKRVDFSDIISNPITLDEIPKNSLVIFDDIEAIVNNKIKKKIYELKDIIYTTGRHRNISIISIVHNLQNNKDTKVDLLESKYIVLFPRAGDLYHIKNVMKLYLGIDNKKIEEIINETKLNSRWLLYHKNFPHYYITEKKISIL